MKTTILARSALAYNNAVSAALISVFFAMAEAMRASICDKFNEAAADISTNSIPISANGILALPIYA
ncbi:MAG: hypothetical protein GQ469_02255 [Methanosarcinales archaeon]|nr:hypothetical protein [Methanosarcinales archaeon]